MLVLIEDEDEEPLAEDGDDAADETVYVWKDTLDSVLCFLALRTQWTYADGNRIGLNHVAARSEIRERVRGRQAQRDMMDDIKVMELAALEIFADQAVRRHARFKAELDRKIAAGK